MNTVILSVVSGRGQLSLSGCSNHGRVLLEVPENGIGLVVVLVTRERDRSAQAATS